MQAGRPNGAHQQSIVLLLQYASDKITSPGRRTRGWFLLGSTLSPTQPPRLKKYRGRYLDLGLEGSVSRTNGARRAEMWSSTLRLALLFVTLFIYVSGQVTLEFGQSCALTGPRQSASVLHATPSRPALGLLLDKTGHYVNENSNPINH